jgi:hypothetical protein
LDVKGGKVNDKPFFKSFLSFPKEIICLGIVASVESENSFWDSKNLSKNASLGV